MAHSIEQLLTEMGPSRSSALVERLLGEGITREAARQRLSRVTKPIHKLYGLSLPNREGFLYLAEQFPTAEFRESLAKTLRETNSAYGRALQGLEARSGVIRTEFFPIASGQPVENARGHLLHSRVEQKLCELKLVNKVQTPDGEFVVSWNHGGMSDRRRATILVEDIVLSTMKVWLGKLGWTSSKAPTVRSPGRPLSKVGQFAWDLVGPSYLNCAVTRNKDGIKNAFIAADILLDRSISLLDLQPFFAKWNCLQAQRRPTRLQPMFIAESFEEDALHELRKRGCIIAIPGTIFGEEIARKLKELISSIEHAAAAVTKDPKSLFDLIGRIGKLEGASLNMRGVILELIVAHLYKLRGYSIDIRQKVASEMGDKAEIDVKATDRREVICVECKGKAPGTLVDEQEITDWVEKSLPRIKSWLKLAKSLPNKRGFAFYTSTDYTDRAKALIDELSRMHKKQPIMFYKGDDVLAELRDQNESSLVDIFREHFALKRD